MNIIAFAIGFLIGCLLGGQLGTALARRSILERMQPMFDSMRRTAVDAEKARLRAEAETEKAGDLCRRAEAVARNRRIYSFRTLANTGRNRN